MNRHIFIVFALFITLTSHLAITAEAATRIDKRIIKKCQTPLAPVESEPNAAAEEEPWDRDNSSVDYPLKSRRVPSEWQVPDDLSEDSVWPIAIDPGEF